MRPIERGPWPLTTQNKPKSFNTPTNAKPDLVERTGPYCHFCEMKATGAGLAVEHIEAKSLNPSLIDQWDNFLLICTACNSRKGAKSLAIPLADHYYWPHLHNTLLAFEYDVLASGKVQPHSSLSIAQKAKAQATISLYDLDAESTKEGNPDERFLARDKARYIALDRLIEYKKGQATIAAIVDSAISSGFFSIYWQIFADEPDVRKALLDAPDFHLDKLKHCFDSHSLQALPRSPGQADPL